MHCVLHCSSSSTLAVLPAFMSKHATSRPCQLFSSSSAAPQLRWPHYNAARVTDHYLCLVSTH
eukprot:19351-Heterococcus_DN1.PRE.2